MSYVGFRQLSRISKQNDTCRNNGVEVCWYNQCRASAPARALVAQKMNNLRTTSPLAKATAYTPRADVCTSHHEFHIVPSAPSQSEHRCRQRQVTHEREPREPRLRRPPFSAVSLRHGRAPLLLHYPSRYPARHTPRGAPRSSLVRRTCPSPRRALTAPSPAQSPPADPPAAPPAEGVPPAVPPAEPPLSPRRSPEVRRSMRRRRSVSRSWSGVGLG